MQKVFSARDPIEAQLVCDWLIAEGIRAEVLGDVLWGTRGAVPIAPETEPAVWVADQDAEAAGAALRRFARESKAPHSHWRCRACSEDVESGFDACWKCGAPRSRDDVTGAGADFRETAPEPGVAAEPSNDDSTETEEESSPSAGETPARGIEAPAAQQFARVPRQRIPVATVVLAVVLVALYRVSHRGPEETWNSQLYAWGLRYPTAIWQGKIGGLFMNPLLHGHAVHLVVNLVLFVVAGFFVERAIGIWRFLLLAIATAFITSSIALGLASHVQLGASGVTAGMIGFVLAAQRRQAIAPVWMVVLLSAFSAWRVLVDAADLLQDLTGEEHRPGWMSLEYALRGPGLVFGACAALSFFPERRRGRSTFLLGSMSAFGLVCLFWVPWQITWRVWSEFRHRNLSALKVDATKMSRIPSHASNGYWYLAVAEEWDGDLNAALAATEGVFKENPFDPFTLILRANLHEERGRRAMARADLQSAARNAGTLEEIHTAWSRDLQFEGEFGKSLDEVNVDLRRHPRQGEALLQRGTLLGDMGRFDEALTDLNQAVTELHEPAAAYLERALVFQATGDRTRSMADLHAAQRLIDRLLDRTPRDPSSNLSRAWIALEIGELDSAERSLQRLSDVAPRWFLTRHCAGRILLERGRLEDADAAFEEALKEAPNSTGSLLGRGEARLRLGRAEEALLDFRRVRELNPANARAWSLEGAALRTVDRLDESTAATAEAIKINPRLGAAWFERSLLALRQDRPNQAASDRAKALELDPSLEKRSWK